MSFDWVAKPASMLVNQLLEKWENAADGTNGLA